MDNKIFNVNGRSKECFKLALQLLLSQEEFNKPKIHAWSINPHKGLILYNYHSGDSIAFPIPLSCDAVVDMVWEWLQNDESKKIELDNIDKNSVGFDGSIAKGWRVYLEQDSPSNVLGIITPSHLYYGK